MLLQHDVVVLLISLQTCCDCIYCPGFWTLCRRPLFCTMPCSSTLNQINWFSWIKWVKFAYKIFSTVSSFNQIAQWSNECVAPQVFPYPCTSNFLLFIIQGVFPAHSLCFSEKREKKHLLTHNTTFYGFLTSWKEFFSVSAFLVAVNCWSVSLASHTQVILLIVKIFALVLIIVPGIMALAKGSYTLIIFYVYNDC